jgi:hypothetical protein
MRQQGSPPAKSFEAGLPKVQVELDSIALDLMTPDLVTAVAGNAADSPASEGPQQQTTIDRPLDAETSKHEMTESCTDVETAEGEGMAEGEEVQDSAHVKQLRRVRGFQKLATDDPGAGSVSRAGCYNSYRTCCSVLALAVVASASSVTAGFSTALNLDQLLGSLELILPWTALPPQLPPHAPPSTPLLPPMMPPSPQPPPVAPPPIIPPAVPPPPAPPGPSCDSLLAGRENLAVRKPPAYCNHYNHNQSRCDKAYVVDHEAPIPCQFDATTGACTLSGRHQVMCNLADSLVSMGGRCDATVAYAFLTRGTLPLWDVWEVYFAGCPNGSIVPVIHAQDMSHELRSDLQHTADKYGGRLLGLDETVQGDLRFSWKMIAATLHLYRAAGQMVAPNGCRPRFVHLVSERDAPIARCTEVLSELSFTAGSSRVQWVDKRIEWVQEHIPPAYRPMAETSQWMTLWMEHAAALAEDEDAMQAKWMPHWSSNGAINDFGFHSAPDEIILASELENRGFRVTSGGMTFVSWCSGDWHSCTRVDTYDTSSPSAYIRLKPAISFCRRARKAGFFFARKFGDGSPSSSKEVFRALTSDECLESPRVS